MCNRSIKTHSFLSPRADTCACANPARDSRPLFVQSFQRWNIKPKPLLYINLVYFSLLIFNSLVTHSRVVLRLCSAGIQSWNGDAGLSMLDNEAGFQWAYNNKTTIQSFILTYWPHIQSQAIWSVCVQWIILNEF